MNLETACIQLDIPIDFFSNQQWQSEDDLQEIYQIRNAYLKKQYRKYALASHPDKNMGVSSSETFQKVKEAYDYLNHFIDEERYKEYQDEGFVDENTEIFAPSILPPYITKIVKCFTQSAFFDENSEMIETILDKVFVICEKQMIKWLENIELRKYKLAYKILKKFRNVFRLTDEFYLLLEELDKRRMNPEYGQNLYKTISQQRVNIMSVTQCDKTNIIKIEPRLEDVMEDMIYKLVKDGKQYLIPLWHHELVYDHNGTDLIIQIEPLFSLNNLDKNKKKIWIDSENNVFQSLSFSLAHLFELSINKEEIEIMFGNKKMCLFPSELLLRQTQTYTWKNEGMSKIQEQNIFDSSERGDLMLEIILKK
jgi:curved DNA-binding protein CbpA